VELVLAQLSRFPSTWLAIVDNGSTDGTGAYLEQLAAKDGRVIVAHEPNPGLYHARACGLALVRGNYLIFADDDIVPGRNWPEGLIAELLADSRVGAVGGAIDPIWDGTPPTWMTDRHARNIFGGSIPGGRMRCAFPQYPNGACMALRAGDFLQLYAAPERHKVPLGWGATSAPADAVGGEDWDLSELFIKNGFLAILVDSVRVGHRVLAEKITASWLLSKYESDGRCRIRYARFAEYPLLSHRVLILMMAFPALWLCDRVLQVAGILGPRIVTIQAYSRKASGIWKELLWGVRGIRFPFRLDSR
jgi:glycosyltransferase involved in cell wall biosynthesis